MEPFTYSEYFKSVQIFLFFTLLVAILVQLEVKWGEYILKAAENTT